LTVSAPVPAVTLCVPVPRVMVLPPLPALMARLSLLAVKVVDVPSMVTVLETGDRDGRVHVHRCRRR
jgi:hypothetical protein